MDITNVQTLEDYLASLTITWIPVTYLNGWVDFDTNRKSEYYKDALGYVHLRLGCKNGTTEYPFEMPDGYIPNKWTQEPIITYLTGSSFAYTPNVILNTNGIVLFNNYSNVACINTEIVYKAA